MHDQVLERFHRALIEEIQTQRPEYLTSPFTVAEIYQNLVPYGSHRDRIGVEMNGDYEDALLRLLAGEGGYLILDSEPGLRDLRAELESPNPNTGVYREFAAVDVRLNQAYLDLASSALGDLPDLVRALDAEDPVTMADLAPVEEIASGSIDIVPPGADIFGATPAARATPAAPVAPPPVAAQPVAPAGPPAGATGARPPLAPEFVEQVSAPGAAAKAPVAGPAASKGGEAEACRWCIEPLPARPGLNFCPFCGSDLSLIPCRACGSAIEQGWRFCASCGTEVDD